MSTQRCRWFVVLAVVGSFIGISMVDLGRGIWARVDIVLIF